MKKVIYNFLKWLIPYVAPDSDEEPPKMPIMKVFHNRNNEDLAFGVINDLLYEIDNGEIKSIKVIYNHENQDKPEERVFSRCEGRNNMKLNEDYELNYLGVVFRDKNKHESYPVLDIRQTWAVLFLIKKYTETGSLQKLLEQFQKEKF